jgi:hypothetical protein
MTGFSRSSIVTAMPYAYPSFLNKGNDPLRMQVLNCFGSPSIFVDVGENLVMPNDVAMPSNPPFASIENEELEETLFDEAPFDEAPLDVNVFQWSREEKPSRRVVCIRIDCSA